MLSEKEIEKAKNWLSALDINSEFEAISKEIISEYIKELENKIEAKEIKHEHDVKMIDEVKGEAVKLYKEIDKLNKTIDEMADIIKEGTIMIEVDKKSTRWQEGLTDYINKRKQEKR